MPAARDVLGGGRLVAITALAMAALCAGLLAAYGTGEEGLGRTTRVTARIALVIFALAYAASPLRSIWRSPLSTWLLRNRRSVGLSFAVAFGFHALAILGLVVVLKGAFEYDPVSLGVGGTAYLFAALMAATSSDRAVAALGPERWRRLHRTGLHLLWFVFAVTAVPAALESPLHAFLAALIVAAAGLRARAALARRRAPAAHAAASEA